MYLADNCKSCHAKISCDKSAENASGMRLLPPGYIYQDIWNVQVRLLNAIHHSHSPFFRKFKLRDAEKTVAAVTQLLDDSSSLPGQLVRVLHGSFVGIDFALSDEDGDNTNSLHTYIRTYSTNRNEILTNNATF